MRAEKDIKAERKRKGKKRILKLALALLGVLILLVVFLVPVFVSSESGRKIILSKINASIDGKTNFGSLSMSWWRGVKVTDFSFNNSARRIFVNVKRIITKPHYGSILMGELSFGRTEITEPKVEINLKGGRPKKTEGSKREGRESKGHRPITLPIKRIDVIVNKGNLKVTDAQAKTVELSQINSKVNLRPPGQQTNFDIDMTVAGKGKESKISAEGKVTPKKKTGWSFEGTSGDFTVEVNDLDLGSLGSILALGGIDIRTEGRVSANIKSKIKDGRIEDLNGTIKGRDLEITGGQLKKGDRLKTSVLDIAVKLRSDKETINIDKLVVHSDWADAEASGVIPKTFNSLAEFVRPDSAYNLRGNLECDLARVLSQMPQTFGLKEGMELTSGRLSGSIETFTKAGRKQISGQASIAGIKGVLDGKRIALSEPVRTTVEVTSDKTGIKFDKLDVSAAFCNISCAGTSKLLQYAADVDLAKLQSELGQFVDLGQYRMAGELFSKGEVSGSKDKISAVGSSAVKELRLTSAKGVSASEPMADMTFAAVVQPDRNIIDVNFIKAKASFGEVNIKDAVLPLNKKAAKPMELSVSAKDINLEKLQPFAVLFASFPKETELGGIAESQLSISSKKDTYIIRSDSTKIRNLRLVSPGKQPFVQREVEAIFDAEINPEEKSIAVKKLQLISPQIKIRKGNFSETTKEGKTSLRGQVDCEYDWSAVTNVAGALLPTGLKLEGRRENTISFSSEYPAGKREELLANLNLSTTGKLGFDSAYYKGLTFGPTEAEIRIVKGLFAISPFSSKVNNGILRFAAEADFKKKPTLLATSRPIQMVENVQINDDVSRELLAYVNPIFANAFNVSGLGNFNCERLALPLSGASKDNLEVVGTISLDNMHFSASDLLGQLLSLGGLRFRGQNIRVHPTRFALQNGFLRYDDMQIDVGDNPVNFKGVVGLSGKSLNMIVTLPYTLDGRAVRIGEEKNSKRISIPLKGTIDKPELDTSKMLEMQLKQQLENRLKEKIFEGLDKILK